MDDYLQYIIVVVAVIAAIVSKIRTQEKADNDKNNKKPTVVPSEPENKKGNTILENWEKWFEADETKVSPLKQEPVNVSIHPSPKNAELSTAKKQVTTADHKEKEDISLKNEIFENTPDIQLDTVEDVRRAIIYSEIIQRKY
nr:hypothetical protein [uncultured Bacteroides sp.]